MKCKVFSLEIISTFLHTVYINCTGRWTILSVLIVFNLAKVWLLAKYSSPVDQTWQAFCFSARYFAHKIISF